MSGIQSLMSVGSLILFTMLILQRNSLTINHISRTLQIEAIAASTSLGQSIIERIHSVAFDEKTTIKEVETSNELSDVLGPEAGESMLAQFDDVDDYNGFSWNGATEKFGTMNAKVIVSYGTEANPDIISSTKTFFKKVEVRVTNQYLMNDTVSIKTIRGY
jgi:hypothetical protein